MYYLKELFNIFSSSEILLISEQKKEKIRGVAGPPQTSNMESFSTIVKPSNVVSKLCSLDVTRRSKNSAIKNIYIAVDIPIIIEDGMATPWQHL